MRRIIGIITVAGIAAGASAQVWQQLPDYNGCLGCGFFSDAVPGQYWSQRIADNFNLGGSKTINRVVWWGMSEYFIYPNLTNFSAWTIEFYDSSFQQIASQMINKGNITITQDANIFGDYWVYKFDVMISPVSVDNGWISIGSHNISPNDDGFAWHFGLSGDGTIAADFFNGNGYQQFPGAGDVAFALYEIPAPGTLALVGLGGLVAARRRR